MAKKQVKVAEKPIDMALVVEKQNNEARAKSLKAEIEMEEERIKNSTNRKKMLEKILKDLE